MPVFLIVSVLCLALGIWLIQKITLVILGVVVAGVVGTLADKMVPGELPFGIPGAILAGWLGFVLGHKVMGDFGPSIAGYYLLPGFVGALAIAFVAELVGSKKSQA
jgi:uncharacterized membrane protein YeaQ/YmgE (transglycosylase-associated protein family)